jgi:hypothetical protein
MSRRTGWRNRRCGDAGKGGGPGFGLNLQDLLFPSTRLGLVGFAPWSRDECGPDTSAAAVFLGDAKDLWSLLAAKKVHRSFALLRMTGRGAFLRAVRFHHV